MKINLEYGAVGGEPELSNSELTLNYVGFAVSQTYKDGLDGQLRRIWGRIQRKFDEAIEAKTDVIELEEAEKDFILKSFKDVKFPSGLAKFIVILEEEINML